MGRAVGSDGEDQQQELWPRGRDIPGADRFGFVAYPIGFSFTGGAIEPVPNHHEVIESVREQSFRPNSNPIDPARDWRDEQRIIFPPVIHSGVRTRRGFLDVPNSDRPATIFRVPATHAIRLDRFSGAPTEAREADTGFLIRAFAFLFDSAAQFHSWWFDAPISFGAYNLDPTEEVAAEFLSKAYRTWLRWDVEQQQAMIAVLKMFARAPGYQWYWEQFAWEYTVTDACYKLAKKEIDHSLPFPGFHKQRLPLLIRSLGLSLTPEEQGWIDTIVPLRNTLIHEARWAGHLPSSKTSQRAVQTPLVLHQLNQRLIVALLGFECEFVRTPWDRNGHARFELPTK